MVTITGVVGEDYRNIVHYLLALMPIFDPNGDFSDVYTALNLDAVNDFKSDIYISGNCKYYYEIEDGICLLILSPNF